MRKSLLAAVLLVALVATPGVHAAADPDRASIIELSSEWVEALNDGDLAEVMAGFASGPALHLDSVEPLRNLGAIAAYYRSLFREAESQFVYKSDSLEIDGDWAFESFHARVHISQAGGADSEWSTELSYEDTGVRVYRREVDGSWKIDREVWNGTHGGGERVARAIMPKDGAIG